MDGTLIGTYRVLKKLGEGGMGAVDTAEHTLLDHPRAPHRGDGRRATDPASGARAWSAEAFCADGDKRGAAGQRAEACAAVDASNRIEPWAAGLGARRARADGFRMCPDAQAPCGQAVGAQELLNQGRTTATIASISCGAGAAAPVGFAVLWLIGAPERVRGHVAIAPSGCAGGAAFDVSVRF
jgi:hypothetical protein